MHPFLVWVVTAAVSLAGCAPWMARPAHSARVETVDVDALIPAPRPRAQRFAVTHEVVFETDMGPVVLGLFGNDAPITVKNFLSYVRRGYYEGKVFHRVIPGFMVQGGGFDENFAQGSTATPIPLEIVPGLEHGPGVVSMARTEELQSATSQFFICVNEAPQLNGEYAAFGVVQEGYGVVVRLSQVPTTSVTTELGQFDDVPVTPVHILSARILETAASQ